MTKKTSRMQRYCQRCQISSNLRTCAKLCETCVDKGWRWCTTGQHVVQVVPGVQWRKRCAECKRHIERRAWHKQRGNPTDPPNGYVPTSVIAARLYYTEMTIVRWLRDGWMKESAWRRPGKGSHWYVEDRPSYEPWRREEEYPSLPIPISGKD